MFMFLWVFFLFVLFCFLPLFVFIIIVIVSFIVTDIIVDLKMIILGDLNYNYVVNESLHSNPIHYTESLCNMSQLITEKTRVTQSTESTLDVILTTNPSLHKRSGVIMKILSDHYMIFIELSVPKKVLQDNHNTVTFQNYSRYDDHEFIEGMKSNDLLNGNCKDVKWGNWKKRFLTRF